jgi:hypothetical protein
MMFVTPFLSRSVCLSVIMAFPRESNAVLSSVRHYQKMAAVQRQCFSR